MPETADTRISKIVEIAQELRNGKRFDITRLTRIKSLCEDPNATAQFTIYIARLTKKGMETATRPDHLDSLEWEQHKELVTETISRMESYLGSPTPEKVSVLRKLLPQLEQVQGQREGMYGTLIRIIHNRYVLLKRFNPETWIPFELAQESDVTLRIYEARGVLVREISLGRKPADSYIDRSKAIY